GGWSMAAAGSDIFSFTTHNLTLNKHDFSSRTGGVDMAFRTLSRTHIVASVDYESMNRKSEVRKIIGSDNLPRQQMTSFSRVPIMLSVRQYLTTRGRSIGQLAWIPSRFAAYVGAGVGYTWYRFNQHGDFIDFKTMDVFPAVLQSDGWTPSAQLMA